MGKLVKVATVAKRIAPAAYQGGKALLVNNKTVIERNNELLVELNEKIEKQNSLKHAVIIGLARGVGTAIGATIVAAVVFAILGQAIATVDDVPIINDIIEQLNLEKAVER